MLKSLLTLLLPLFVSVNSAAAGVEFFEGGFDEALKKAEEENKIVFIDFHTEWCGYCRVMERTIFTQEQVGDFYNNHFISLKIDAEDEEMNGPYLADRYDATGFPTFVFVDAAGNVKYKAGGGMGSDLFLEMGKNAIEKSYTLAELEYRYQMGERDREFMQIYLAKVRLEGFDLSMSLPPAVRELYRKTVTEVAERYFESLQPGELLSVDTFGLFSYFLSPYRGGDTVEFMVSSYDKYEQIVPVDELADLAVRINNNSIRELSKGGDSSYLRYLADIKGVLKGAYSKEGGASKGVNYWHKLMSLLAGKNVALHDKDWNNYLTFTNELIAHKEGKVDMGWYEWYGYARDLLDSGCEDVFYLKQAEVFAVKARDLEENKLTVSLCQDIFEKTDGKSK